MILVFLLLSVVSCFIQAPFEDDIYLTGEVTEFELKSPNYPNSISSSQTYKWRIMTDPGSRIRINFASFNIPENPACTSLWVSITDRDMMTESDPQPRWCGSNSPHYAISRSNNIFIYVFAKSNLSSSSRNFILKLEVTSEESNLDQLYQGNAENLKEAGVEMVMPSGGGEAVPFAPPPPAYPQPFNPLAPAPFQPPSMPNYPPSEPYQPADPFSPVNPYQAANPYGLPNAITEQQIVNGQMYNIPYSPDQHQPYLPAGSTWSYQPKMASAEPFEPLPPRASTNNSGAWIGAVVGLLLSMIICSIVIYRFVIDRRRRKEEQEEVVTERERRREKRERV